MGLQFILEDIMDQCKYDCNSSLQLLSALVHADHANHFILNIFLNILLLYITPYLRTSAI